MPNYIHRKTFETVRATDLDEAARIIAAAEWGGVAQYYAGRSPDEYTRNRDRFIELAKKAAENDLVIVANLFP